MNAELRDAQARRQIREDTHATLFVNAGAGSGKTKSLIDRIVTCVMDDGVPLRSVAAVTFTEKAGAELRDRLRAVFEAEERGAPRETSRADRATAALEDLDRAAIGTLHSFAQRILREHAIAAKLPPLVEVQDEVASSVAFDERWASVQMSLLDDDAMERPLLIALAAGVKLEHLRSLMRRLGGDWDLLEDRVLSEPPQPVTVPDIGALRRRIIELLEKRSWCPDNGDKLRLALDAFEETLAVLDAAHDDSEVLDALSRLAGKFGRMGQAPKWGGSQRIAEVREAASDVVEHAGEIKAHVLDSALRTLTRWLSAQVLEHAQARRREGRLEFQDLLVLSRDLLRRDAGARAALQAKYQRLLLDEFQDTDPLQIEIAVRIAGGAAASAEDWRAVVVPEGRLFVVGDAKQSIYRFRRADIATYLEAQQVVGQQLSLTTNFRTVAPVLDWVNAVFSKLIQAADGEQPEYEGLDESRSEPPTVGAPVTVLGAVEHGDEPRADALREREAADVAGVIRRALAERWTVSDKAGGWRPVRLGDIAVLVPARTSLPFLEDAFEGAGVPYRAEASSLVYETEEVRALFAAARAIADATDELSFVTALRSPLFGCGDDDLWRWRHAGGRLRMWSRAPEDTAEAAGPVGQAKAALEAMARRVRWAAPSEVLTAIITERRMLEAAIGRGRPRDVWRSLRFVVDQARAWSEVAGGGLRGYLAWVARQSDDSARVAESVLPELDVDAVRIMTIHAAKGLEFPMVVLSGMTAQPNRGRGVRLLWPRPGGYDVALTAAVKTGSFEAGLPLDEQMGDAERIRLLYVAITRARDHLVVSLHRSPKGQVTAARQLAGAGAATAAGAVAFDGEGELAAVAGSAVGLGEVAPAPDWDEWAAGAARAREAPERSGGITASGLEGTEPEVVLEAEPEVPPGAAKGPRDLELPPWSKGRYGSAVGRAVHGVLQSIDLTTGAGLEAAVEAQAVAEGVVEQRELVTALVRSALASDLVQHAAAREHWSESYVGAELDGELHEGYIDLIYREDDGSLVVVDYKTDAIPAGAIETRVEYYRPQLEAYVRCLRRATGADVEARLLFLHPELAVERAV